MAGRWLWFLLFLCVPRLVFAQLDITGTDKMDYIVLSDTVTAVRIRPSTYDAQLAIEVRPKAGTWVASLKRRSRNDSSVPLGIIGTSLSTSGIITVNNPSGLYLLSLDLCGACKVEVSIRKTPRYHQ